MAIFAKRRIQSMLTDLSEFLDTGGLKDLQSRVRTSDTNHALAAEGELAILWAISKVAHFVHEPELPNSTKRPDAWSNDLLASGPAVIEIRALSDDNLPSKKAMDRTANIICGFADQIRKEAGSRLHFRFQEEIQPKPGHYRKICVDPNFQITDSIRDQLKNWIALPSWSNSSAIRVQSDTTDVTITYSESPSRLFRTESSLPNVAYDLEDNPIYKAIKDKRKQIRDAPNGTLRCIALVDAGCGLLWRGAAFGAPPEVGADQIIRHALHKLSIDIVFVFSPQRPNIYGSYGNSGNIWKISYFDRRAFVPDDEFRKIDEMANLLPKPYLEGYQARDMHKQGVFSSNSNFQDLPTEITSKQGGKMTIKLSANLLHRYLAGVIDPEKFKIDAFGKGANLFQLELAREHSIQNISFEPGGLDEDDDFVAIELDIDRGHADD